MPVGHRRGRDISKAAPAGFFLLLIFFALGDVEPGADDFYRIALVISNEYGVVAEPRIVTA